MKRLVLLATVLACAACVTTRQEGEDMRKRIDAMEKTVKEQGESSAADRQKLLNEEKRLQDALDALNRAARKSGADLAVDLEKAQNDLAQIRGTLEVIGHRLDAVDAQNAERDKKIEANTQAIAQKQKEAQAAARPADKTALYALGRQKLELGDEAGARQLFAEFVQRYKNDELAPNAQYWIGDSLYGEGRYNDAIVEFQKVIKDYKSSDKVPDALLKIGMSFQAQKDCKNALLFYEEVTQAHKGDPAAKTAKEKERECKKRTASKRK
ncbi:MAG: tol-pal system protein YbgF [Myxococcales bacterium]